MKKHWLPLFSITAAIFVVTLPLLAQGRGGRGGPPVNMPDGAAKETVQALCANCHSLNMIVNSGGYTKDGWRMLIATMVALPPDQVDAVTGYLATNFPEQPRPGGGDPRGREGDVQGVGGADARVAAARSAGDARRHALVHRQFSNRHRAAWT